MLLAKDQDMIQALAAQRSREPLRVRGRSRAAWPASGAGESSSARCSSRTTNHASGTTNGGHRPGARSAAAQPSQPAQTGPHLGKPDTGSTATLPDRHELPHGRRWRRQRAR
jgi:hypothetical protein